MLYLHIVDCKNLIYYSLLHVAITRQKKLYVSLKFAHNLWDVFSNVSKTQSDNSIKKDYKSSIKLDNIIKNVKFRRLFNVI